MPDKPMTDIPIELEACPFCGRDDDLQVQRTGAADEWWSGVYCDHCCTYGPTAATEAEAISAWNTRAPDPALKECVEALGDALELLNQNIITPDEMNAVGKKLEATLAAMTKGEE